MIYIFNDFIVHFVLLTAAVKLALLQSYSRNYFLIETSKHMHFFNRSPQIKDFLSAASYIRIWIEPLTADFLHGIKGTNLDWFKTYFTLPSRHEN